ncbi:MAG TPA: hypothetical protein VM364_00780 [Vicinamibacterales bacterium]|nr:hypothetical protein [Vicinamibacterales bacterium]
MSAIVWHTLGLAEIEAWHRADGTELRCVLRIEHVAWPHAFRIRAYRPLETAFDPLVLTLRHSALSIDDAKRLAELLESEFPAERHDERSLEQLLDEHRRQREAAQPRPTRCQFVHAWKVGARDSDACLCGSVTKGFARDAGLAVPA